MNISVIIPTIDEEKHIDDTLAQLLKLKPHEILVADGGSRDRTVSIASGRAQVVFSSRGRARQMNEGARRASGDVFLFLHADTRLPEQALGLIREALEKGHEAGRFRMRFDENHWLLRIYSSYTRFQFFSYGDQAFFVTRNLFEKLGGFRENTPFEDIDFYKRLRRVTKPVILKEPVVTSARRFLQVGCLKQKLINLMLVSLYTTGFNVTPFKERFYPEIR